MTEPIAVVTGASRGIGQAVAIELANRGHRVLATIRDLAAAQAMLAAAGPAAERIEVTALDVTRPGEFTFPEATAVPVNNAGGIERDPVRSATMSKFWPPVCHRIITWPPSSMTVAPVR